MSILSRDNLFKVFSIFLLVVSLMFSGLPISDLYAAPKNPRPLVEILSPSDGDYVGSSSQEVRVKFKKRLKELTLHIDGQLYDSVIFSKKQPEDYTFSWDTTGYSDGNHTLQAYAYPKNSKFPTSSSKIINVIVDNNPPSIYITEPLDGSVSSDTTPYIKIEYNDAGSGLDISNLQVLIDNIDYTNSFSINPTYADYQVSSVDPFAEGMHTIYASISDNISTSNNVSSSFEVKVSLPPEPPVVSESGFIHGVVYNSRTEVPIDGVYITVVGIEGAVLTNTEGKFSFPTPGTGEFGLTIKKSGFTFAQRKAIVLTTRDVAVEDTYLTPIDSQVTTITQAGGVATNSTGTVELIFPEGAVSTDIDVTATQFQKSRELPGALPEQSFFTYALEFGPDETTFSKPVKFRLLNHLGFPAGTPIPIGYYNQNTMRWEDAGMGVVVGDGTWAEFDITHFSSYDANVATKDSNDARPPDKSKTGVNDDYIVSQEQDPGEARIGIKTGSVSIDYSLPAVRTLGRTSALTLTYNSRSAYPKAMINSFALLNPSTLLTPETTTFNVNFAGYLKEVVFEGSDWDIHQRIVLDPINARGDMLSTGTYQYKIGLSNEYQAEYATADYFGGPPVAGTGVMAPELKSLLIPLTGNLVINNNIESPFGAGWSLQGLSQLHFNPDDSVILTLGDGSALTFTEALSAHSFLPDITQDPESPYGFSLSNSPESLTFDTAGNIYVVDRGNSKVLKANSSGAITTYADGFISPRGIAFDSVGNGYVSDQTGLTGTIYKITPQGDRSIFYTNTIAQFWDIAFDSKDNLFIASSPPFQKGTVIKVTPQGTASIFATVDGFVYGVCFDDKDNLYATETVTAIYGVGGGLVDISGSSRVFKVTPDEFLSTYAVGFDVPRGLCFDNQTGNLYVVDEWADKIMRVTREHLVEEVLFGDDNESKVTPLVGSIGFFEPRDLALDNNGNIFSTNRFFGRAPYNSIFGTVSIVTSDNSYIPPAGDYTRLIKNEDNTFTRITKDGVMIHFNQEGYQTSIVDKNNNTIIFSYDVDNKLTAITDAVGGVTSFSYDSFNHLKQVIDSAGRITLFEVDAEGNLIKITAPDATITQYGYDQEHLLVSQTTPRGFITDYIYDENGCIKEEIYPEREILENQTIIRKREKTIFYPNDSQGLVNNLDEGVGTPANPAPAVNDQDIRYEIIHGASSTTGLTNDIGGLIEETDALGNITIIERDDNNNPTKIHKANDLETVFTYDANGNITNTQSSYTPEGIAPIPLTSATFNYESNFNQLSEILFPNPRTAFEYDQSGNLIHISAPYGESPLSENTYFTYDSKGLLASITDALGNVTSFSYDSKGNLTQTIDPIGNTTTLTYDDAGNVVSSTDASARVTTFEYDLLNRLISTTDAQGNITRYEYDANGNLTKVIDPKGNMTVFVYDEIDQLITITNALGYQKQFAYDEKRNLALTEDANGNSTTFSYDILDRLIQKILPDDIVDFTYDTVGNLINIEDADSKLIMSYDALSRLTEVITGDASNPSIVQPETTISYSYDDRSNRTKIIDPLGGITNYSYDYYYNYLKSITNPNLEVINFTYDDLNRRTSIGMSNGVITNYTYDAISQLLNLAHTDGVNPIASFNYAYDSVGNRTEITEQSGLNSYVYDNLNRLTNATHPQSENTTELFTYDTTGNRLNSHISSSYTYDANNRLLEDNQYQYTYDNNGNLTQKQDKSTAEVTTYIYNSQNQLIRIDFPDLTYATYAYDGLGRRIQKNNNNSITKYIYDNEDILFEYDNTNTPITRYTHGPGVDEPLIAERGGSSYYYLSDGLGSIVAITDSTGNIVKSYTYDSFGNIVDEQGTLLNTYTYTSRELDFESGLYYYRARYYDPFIGRFLSEDPIGFLGGVNFYSYVANNPMNLVDPYGLKLYKISGGSTAVSVRFLIGFSGAVYKITDVMTGDSVTYFVTGIGVGIGGSLDIVKERYFNADISNVTDFKGASWEATFVPLFYKQSVNTRMGFTEGYTGVGGTTLGVELSGNRVYYWPLNIENKKGTENKRK